jgi:hypothetical protein
MMSNNQTLQLSKISLATELGAEYEGLKGHRVIVITKVPRGYTRIHYPRIHNFPGKNGINLNYYSAITTRVASGLKSRLSRFTEIQGFGAINVSRTVGQWHVHLRPHPVPWGNNLKLALRPGEKVIRGPSRGSLFSGQNFWQCLNKNSQGYSWESCNLSTREDCARDIITNTPVH